MFDLASFVCRGFTSSSAEVSIGQ